MPDNPFGDQPQPTPPNYATGKPETISALDAVVPTNPFAFISCYSGILSIVCCPIGLILGPIAIIVGVIGLKKWKVQESTYGETTSKIRIVVGISTGILGSILGVFGGIMMIMSIFAE